jgi:hypothetical protein
MARACDKTGGTNDVQRVVIQVVSGPGYQCHGDFCKEYRDELPAKLQELGFTVVGGNGKPLPKAEGKPSLPQPAKKD